MWFLYKTVDGCDTEDRILLRPGSTYNIGRSGPTLDIIINDKSVSRKHAVITVDAVNDVREALSMTALPSVWLRDENSKFGTFVNHERITSKVKIGDTDVVKFGSFESIMRLRWEPVCLFLGTKHKQERHEIAEIAKQLGIKLAKSWSNACTHLVATKVHFTGSVLRCLLDVKPIVSMQWLKSIVDTDDGQFHWPPLDDTLPIDSHCSIDSRGTPDIHPDRVRSTLFQHREFVILDKAQFILYKDIIEAAKGKARLLSLNPTVDLSFVNDSNVYILKPDVLGQGEDWNRLSEAMRKGKREFTTAQDLGLCIMYCDTSLLSRASSASRATTTPSIPNTSDTSNSFDTANVTEADATANVDNVTSIHTEPIHQNIRQEETDHPVEETNDQLNEINANQVASVNNQEESRESASPSSSVEKCFAAVATEDFIVIKRPIPSSDSSVQNHTPSGVNFKRFKKTVHVSRNSRAFSIPMFES